MNTQAKPLKSPMSFVTSTLLCLSVCLPLTLTPKGAHAASSVKPAPTTTTQPATKSDSGFSDFYTVKKAKHLYEKPLGITFFMPTYVLPFYYSENPNYGYYENKPVTSPPTYNTPGGQKIDPLELKYQISLQMPIIPNIAGDNISLYMAYTQKSYWQAYDDSAFFRQTNYMPEFFLVKPLNITFGQDVRLKLARLSLVHQSNGEGATGERSWNRVYLEGVFDAGPLQISVKPWYIFKGQAGYEKYNPNLADYMGHGRLLFIYNHDNYELSLLLRNNIESGFRRGAEELTFSFPLTEYLKGYVQMFSGYGQNLASYNNYTNSYGLGIAFSDWNFDEYTSN